MGAIITLTTDFGLSDAYVAAVKGVILTINPEANLVDICHTIKPQNISQAAFILGTAYQYFPEGTIHIVVVDPGVGTERKAIILKTPQAYFVAPDNGVLSYVIYDYSALSVDDSISEQEKELVPEMEAVAVTKPQFWRSSVSSTFHGRDIFAPVAAYLSLGLQLIEFGEAITSLAVLPHQRPYRESHGTLVGHVLHVDSFGNLITDIKSHDLPAEKEAVTVEIGERRIRGLSRTYAEGKGILALFGSSGYLEVSLKGGSASDLLNANVGYEVRIR